MNTVERLNNYYPLFTSNNLEIVAEIAERQASYEHYQEFFSYLGIDADSVTKEGIIDVRPKEYDPNIAVFYMLPMANTLDANQLYQVGTIAATNPTRRVIALANPSGPGYGKNTLTRNQRRSVVKGNLFPAIETGVRYLEKLKINQVHHVGYSYGVDLATNAAIHANYEIPSSVLIEPVTAKKRNLVELGIKFMQSSAALQKYIDATEVPSFIDAHKDSIGPLAYNIGLMRLSNIAISRALTRGLFELDLNASLEGRTDTKTTVIWGSQSELAVDGLLSQILSRTSVNRQSNVKGIRLENQKHALANDIHLQAALVLEGLNR